MKLFLERVLPPTQEKSHLERSTPSPQISKNFENVPCQPRATLLLIINVLIGFLMMSLKQRVDVSFAVIKSLFHSMIEGEVGCAKIP